MSVCFSSCQTSVRTVFLRDDRRHFPIKLGKTYTKKNRLNCSNKLSERSSSSESLAISLPDSPEQVSYSFLNKSTATYSESSMTRYEDSFLDKIFMTIFTFKIVGTAGISMSDVNREEDKNDSNAEFSRFVRASEALPLSRDPGVAQKNRDKVVATLTSLLPPFGPAMMRALFPPVQWVCQVNAAIAVAAFAWLVGPCHQDPENPATVKIRKCRYLEATGCVGMCANMCKLPTQEFFKNEFGIPLNMKPDFEDFSCQMIFGEQPPSSDEDPALVSPCLKESCPSATTNTKEPCAKLPLFADATLPIRQLD